MFKIIALVIVGVIAIILAIATIKPNNFRYQKSAVIKAPPGKIFGFINDLHNWPLWSPYEKIDPNMKRTHSGSASGVGAVYEWSGNNKIGAGRMEITESNLSRIVMKLDFIRPFEGHNTAEFTLEPNGDTTTVTWAMYGVAPFIGKVMSLVFNCEKMVGKQFAEGLENLKTLAEK